MFVVSVGLFEVLFCLVFGPDFIFFLGVYGPCLLGLMWLCGDCLYCFFVANLLFRDGWPSPSLLVSPSSHWI